MNTDLLQEYILKIQAALSHLEYSFNVVEKLSSSPNHLSEAELASWEAYTSRFARVIDLYTTKFIKFRVKQEDPAFDGSFRDYLNAAEKMGLVDSVESFLVARKLRNQTAHEYEDQALEAFYEKIRTEGRWVLQSLPKKLKP